MTAIHHDTHAFERQRLGKRRLGLFHVAPIALTEPAEIALAKHLMNLGFTLQAAAEECRPNYLCNYLHELAGLYSSFYEACPVLMAEEPARSTRLALCRLSAQVLRLGLETLGIEVTEKM